MPELRTVYFAPNGEWFHTYEECALYEEVLELERFLRGVGYIGDNVRYHKLAEILVKHFNITKRLDYVTFASGGEIHEFTCPEGEEISPYLGDRTEDSPNGTL